MPGRINLDNISILLQKPRYPENIGAAARAMRNMGIRNLVIVDPQNFDLHKALKLATHFASDILETSKIYAELKEALSTFNYVVGTTARLGGERQVVITPPNLCEKLISISAENRIAILFGPENKGLSNEALRYCHELVNIPTAEFSSLNLAQAVMILCYEIFKASRWEKEEFTPRLANRNELDGMYDQLKDVLVRISYINSENPDYWLNHFRRFFNRLQLRAKEVNIIRGLCRQVDWYGKKCYEDGKNERKNSR
jgi:tRNA/rRNA methyltransferase